jgi:hypothetical protein
MDCPATWRICKWECEWVIEWVRWKHWSSSSSRHQHLYHHHHQSELLTCHGTAMIIRWTVRSRDFYKWVSERERDRVRAKIKRERECVMEGDSATMLKGERASEWLSEWDENIDHLYHVISISIIIISRSNLPVMGQQWSSDGLSEVVISKSVGERERQSKE